MSSSDSVNSEQGSSVETTETVDTQSSQLPDSTQLADVEPIKKPFLESRGYQIFVAVLLGLIFLWIIAHVIFNIKSAEKVTASTFIRGSGW